MNGDECGTADDEPGCESHGFGCRSRDGEANRRCEQDASRVDAHELALRNHLGHHRRNGRAMEGRRDPVFDAFDEIRAVAKREGLAIAGDAYSIELTMGSMGSADCLWVETSVPVK